VVSCEPEVTYEDVDNPIYNAEILYGTPIASRADLEKIGIDEAYPLNGTYDLVQDIDLAGGSWTPLGPDSANPFTGFLNGNGKTIKGLVLQAGEEEELVSIGLFGYLSLARVTNLTLELANDLATPIELSGTGEQDIGALAGYTKDSYISDITVRAGNGKGLSITKSGGDSYIGGVLGKGDSNNQIQNITANLSIEANTGGYNTYGGGIIGSIMGDMRDCTIAGTVEISSTGWIYAGGVVGQVQGQWLIANCTGTGIRVYGETTGTGYNSVFVGGIAGSGSVTNSAVAGSSGIQAKASDSGAQGYLYGGGISGSGTVTSSSVTGTAEIHAESSGLQTTYAGGIVGDGSAASSYTLQGVKVLAKANSTDSIGEWDYIVVAAGGIAGEGRNISNCFSHSAVRLETGLNTTGSTYGRTGAGGLVGDLASNGQVENAYAAGEVAIINSNSENMVFAGGLAGVGPYSTYSFSFSLKNSAALNPSVRVESANSNLDSVHIYRVLGASFNQNDRTVIPSASVPDNDHIILETNYALEAMETQTKIGTGAWEDVNQDPNNLKGLAGDANMEQTQTFFETTLKWDFQGEEGRPAIWKWDAALNLPVLNSN
jgi:hypothetical protein